MHKAVVLSVIVPAHNSKRTIDKCLKAIKESNFRDYELIVVDSGSQDATNSIAARFADKVISLNGVYDRSQVRLAGIKASAGQIIVNIDSDIVIKPDTLTKINDYLLTHPQVDALTGLLSKEHPNPDFFSQYKNLYMNYIFELLPERVTFLFGSICAMRKEVAFFNKCGMRYTPDTEFGQQLFMHGKTIAFLRELEVIHLKKYTAWSFIKNDFRVPFCWARIFLRFGGLRQLGRNRTGFAHAPLTQLVSVGLAPLLMFLAAVGFFIVNAKVLLYFLLIVWFALNVQFFLFLFREHGWLFLLKAIGVTFIDQLVMTAGITAGFLSELKRLLLKSSHHKRMKSHVK